jgi:hypothetical protein
MAAADSWEALKKDGNGYFGAGSFAEAVASYTAALKIAALPAADRATILNNRAMSFIKLKQYLPAIEDCTSSLVHASDASTAMKSLYRRCAGAGRAPTTHSALPI